MPVVTHVGAGERRGGEPAGRPEALARSWPTPCPTSRSSPATTAGTTGWTRRRSTWSASRVDPRDVVAARPWPSSTPSGSSRLIRRHGADRVVFGSDWPMADPAAEIAAIRALASDRGGRATASSATTWLDCSGSRSLSHDSPQGRLRLGCGHGLFLGRQRATRDRDGRARRHRLPLLRPPRRADHVDPREAAGGEPGAGLHPRRHRPAARRPRRAASRRGSRSSPTPVGRTRAPPRRVIRALADARPARRPDRRRPRRRPRGPDRRPRAALGVSFPQPRHRRRARPSATGSPTPRSTPAVRGSSRRSTAARTSWSAAG